MRPNKFACLVTQAACSMGGEDDYAKAEHDILDIMAGLSDSAKDRLAEYVAFLRYQDRMEEQEEAEDIAYIDSLTPEDYENAVPHSVIISDYEAKYGPLH